MQLDGPVDLACYSVDADGPEREPLKEREERWRLIGDKVRGRLAGDATDDSTTRTRIIERSDAVGVDTRAAPRRAPGGGPAKRRPTMTASSGGGVPPRPRKKKR